MSEQEIYIEAMNCPDSADRRRFLDEACGGDGILRERVEKLILRSDQLGSFLEHPIVGSTKLFDETIGARNNSDSAEDVPLDFLEPPELAGSLGRLGRYEILEFIGRGGMGMVLKALDTKLQRIVAVKVLMPELAANATARKRFTREAQAAAAVNHNHVVTIYAVEENGERSEGHPAKQGCLPFLVMEYIDGQSLQEKIDQQGPLELKAILRIGRQIASGLAAAHRQGLIHRNIKPANILLQNGIERVQITDFGLARAVDDVGMTRTGEVTGTPVYMSPEQAMGQPVDGRSDLFSLGSVLYAMCTGRAPFRAETTIAVLRRVCDETPRPIREVTPEIPEWLAALIDRLLEKNPDQRFQSATEVADVLRQQLAHAENPISPPLADSVPLRDKHGPHSQRRRTWGLMTAAMLLVLAVGLGLAEATGTTRLVATVIRILTPDGILVIETDDPNVEVTIEGDGGLVITGAGPQKVHLRPGSYKLQAAKDGKAVRLDRDLVTISRAGKQVVRVSLDRGGTESDESASIEDDIRKLTERIEKSPDDQRAFIDRAHLYARQRRWRDGADDLRAAGEATLQKPGDAFLYAILLVHLREFDLHRRLCEQMLERFAATDDVWTANCLVKSCLLRPGTVDLAKLPLALLIEDREFATNEPEWLLREARAFHAYRSGQLEEARRLVRETLSVPAYKNDPLYAPRALSILAMASHKSGDRQLALDLYQQARQQFDKSQLPAGHPGASSWLFTEIIRREAAQELGLEEASAQSDAAARELAKWQGEWENADYGRLVIHGERWSSYPKNGLEVVSTIKIVEVADEMTHILLLNMGVDGKVRTIQTILRVDGDTLHNCGTFGFVRPTEFATKTGCIYTQWKRVSNPQP